MFLNKHNQEQTKRHSVSEELTIDDFRCLCQFHYDQAISLPHMLVWAKRSAVYFAWLVFSQTYGDQAQVLDKDGLE